MQSTPSASRSPSWYTNEADEEKGGATTEGEEEEDEEEDDDDEVCVSPATKLEPASPLAKEMATERTALTTASEDEDDEDEPERMTVHRGPVLTFFVALSVLSITAALMLAVAHAASLYSFIARRRDTHSRGPVDVALRAYGLIFCATVCCVELELGLNPRVSVVSRYWSLRGLFYAFVGLLALDDAEADERRRDGDQHVPDAWREDSFMPYSLYLRSAATALLALGCLYVLLGMCWCQRCKETRTIEYRKQLAVAEVRNAELAQRRAGSISGEKRRPLPASGSKNAIDNAL